MRTVLRVGAIATVAVLAGGAAPPFATAEDNPGDYVEIYLDSEDTTADAVASALASTHLTLTTSDKVALAQGVDAVRTPRAISDPGDGIGIVQPLTTSTGLKSARAWGARTNGGYTWQLTSTQERVQCRIGYFWCSVTDRWVTTFKIDPGATSTRLGASVLYTPNTGRLKPPTFTVEAWRNNTTKVGTASMTPTPIGYYLKTLVQSSSMRDFPFSFYISGRTGTGLAMRPGKTALGRCDNASLTTCKW